MEKPIVAITYSDPLARKCGLRYVTEGSRAVDLITTKDLWLTDHQSCWAAECMTLEEVQQHRSAITMSNGKTLDDLIEEGKIDPSITPVQSAQVSAGIRLKLPPHYGAMVLPRSGMGSWLGVSLSNTVGLIDTDYHGEVTLAVRLNGQLDLGASSESTYVDTKFNPLVGRIGNMIEAVIIPKGTRIAQMLIMHLPQADFVEVSDFEGYGTRDGGFGSTGVA